MNQEHYLTKIIATLKDGQLQGKIQMRGDQGPEGSAFQAKRHVNAPAAAASAPSIAGNWIVPFESNKGEKAWRFIVKQSGADVTAAILRVDGDTGALTGTFRDGKWLLSHFDGSRPYLAGSHARPRTDRSRWCRRAAARAPGHTDRVSRGRRSGEVSARAVRLHDAYHHERSQRSVRV